LFRRLDCQVLSSVAGCVDASSWPVETGTGDEAAANRFMIRAENLTLGNLAREFKL
jgi:hypothetical protein